jgi:DUF1009 family protein
MRASTDRPAIRHLGMIAGGGTLPLEIARSITARGGNVFAVMIEDEADDALSAFPHTKLNWAELGHAVKALKSAGMSDLVMVGRMSRPSFWTAKPDFGFLFSLPRILRALRAGGDDAVLRGVVRLLEARGLNVLSVADVAPELLLTEGPLGFHHAQQADKDDIAIGMALVAALGHYDIGQAVVVARGMVEGIEGAEGTDRMLGRVRDAREAAGIDVSRLRAGVLVKRPKPGQDKRLDLPAIGPETVAAVIAAGLGGIAGLAGEVLAAGRFEMVERADRARVFVMGVQAQPEAAAETKPAPIEPIVFGRIGIGDDEAADVERGVRIMGELDSFDTGTAILLRRGRVLSVGATETPMELLQRSRGWLKRRKRRSGVMVLGAREALDEALLRAAAATSLAGIVVVFGPGDGPRHKGPVLDVADRFGLFIAGAATDPKAAAF